MRDREGNPLEVGKTYYIHEHENIKEVRLTERDLANYSFYLRMWKFGGDADQVKYKLTLDRKNAENDLLAYLQAKRDGLTKEVENLNERINRLIRNPSSRESQKN